MYSRTLLHKFAALIAAATFAFPLHAQDGAYDPTWGSGGRTWIDVTSYPSEAEVTTIRLPNGNFFMVGGCGGIACAAWLTPSGETASGYGPSGTGTAWFNAYAGWPQDGFQAYDAAAFPDNRVAVIVESGDNVYMILLRADGSGLDPSVGNGAGYVAPSLPMHMLRVTPQQQVIAVGVTHTSPQVIVVSRFDSTFHLDTTFGNGGSTTIGFQGASVFPEGMTLQRDGKIVVIGNVADSPPSVGIVRLTAAGVPDADFGINSDGRFKSAFGNQNGASGSDIVQDKKGRLVFSGYASPASGAWQWLVDRVLSGGAIDATFNGGNPKQFTVFSSSQEATPYACCVGLQSDGRIVVAGTMDRDDKIDKYFSIARFTDAGTFDSSYGIGGQSYGDMSTQAPYVTTDLPTSMVIVPGGIVVAGSTVANGERRFSAAKARIDLLFAADFE